MTALIGSTPVPPVAVTYNNVVYSTYTFTGSGTLSGLSKEVNALVLVVGGGASGGSYLGGGGGAGGVIQGAMKLQSGITYTATVGAGGAAVTSAANNALAGNNGVNSSFGISNSSLGTLYTALGEEVVQQVIIQTGLPYLAEAVGEGRFQMLGHLELADKDSMGEMAMLRTVPLLEEVVLEQLVQTHH